MDKSATGALVAASDEHRSSDGDAILHAKGDPSQLHHCLARWRHSVSHVQVLRRVRHCAVDEHPHLHLTGSVLLDLLSAVRDASAEKRPEDGDRRLDHLICHQCSTVLPLQNCHSSMLPHIYAVRLEEHGQRNLHRCCLLLFDSEHCSSVFLPIDCYGCLLFAHSMENFRGIGYEKERSRSVIRRVASAEWCTYARKGKESNVKDDVRHRGRVHLLLDTICDYDVPSFPHEDRLDSEGCAEVHLCVRGIQLGNFTVSLRIFLV